MNHDAAFLADICEHPDDDTPRLVYADWLDDHGEPARGELIRVQVEQGRLPPNDARLSLLASRAWRLLLDHGGPWRDRLPTIDGVVWGDFARGFVESVVVASVDVFLRHARAIFATAPVRSLRVSKLDADELRRLARSEHLLRLMELNLGNNPALRGGLTYLARSPFVANLTSLLLHNNQLGDEAAVVAEASSLGRLKELYLSGNDLTDHAVVALARSRSFPHLAELDLRDNPLQDRSLVSLANHGMRDALTTLWLTNTRLGPGAAVTLAWTARLPLLARLYLNHNTIDDAGAEAFANSPHRRSLRDLDLRNGCIGVTGARALAESPHLGAIELLWLGGNQLPRDAVIRLVRRFSERVRL